MKKIIINADDCGINSIVNKAIERCIEHNEITSTTIIANMDDFDGACRLYNKYKDKISFGVHLNLTEGKPLTPPKNLLACGIAEMKENGQVKFCGNRKRKRYFSKVQRKAIYKELNAQIYKIKESGITISHIDSHHHIHTDFWILIEVVKLAKIHKIPRIRIISNYTNKGLSFYARQIWCIILRLMYPSVRFTNWFTSYTSFVMNQSDKMKENQVLELMTHPGGYDPNESELLSEKKYVSSFKKITYNQL